MPTLAWACVKPEENRLSCPRKRGHGTRLPIQSTGTNWIDALSLGRIGNRNRPATALTRRGNGSSPTARPARQGAGRERAAWAVLGFVGKHVGWVLAHTRSGQRSRFLRVCASTHPRDRPSPSYGLLDTIRRSWPSTVIARHWKNAGLAHENGRASKPSTPETRPFYGDSNNEKS